MTTSLDESGSSDLAYLRPLDLGDIERIHAWHNDRELYRSLGGAFRHVSRSAVEDWLKARLQASDREVNLAICAKPSGRHVGNLYLRDIDWISRRCELHLFIGSADDRSKGLGTHTVQRALEYATLHLGLQRVGLQVLADNRPAIRVYAKCGFRVEGTLRRYAFKEGQFHDVLVMGFCTDELPGASSPPDAAKAP